MKRLGIIETIGKGFLTENIEGGEFSYIQALGKKVTGHFKIDLRFYSEESHVAILVETKTIYKNKDVKQLFSYVELEQELDSKTKIIAILANTENNMFKIWKIENDDCCELDDRKIKSMEEYIAYFKKQNSNDKTAVLENTSKLNRILHDNGIPEKLRSQFVGTCLLALKNGLVYKDLETDQIISGIKNKLGKLLQESMDKAKKLSVLQTKVLESQNVEAIEGKNFEKILTFIEQSILPYINEASFEGQDILSYFFTTFNKYVAREDKNQAFTPNHICHFMSKVAGIDRKTRVLDPTCGSGTFLVQAMTMELAQCETEKERFDVKSEQIYGIEFDESVFGLSTTNMLIHGDGNSNIRCGSCFENDKWIEHASIDVVLMNPPYNASKSQMPKTFAPKFGKSTTDPSKGLYFVNHILKCVKGQKGRLLALLPMSCAITTKGVILELKKEILENNTLDAVFSFPDEMFYPGASAVACCMVFNVGKPHPKDYETFFGYFKNDGFEKRKGVGRVDVRNKWENIEKEWLDLYHHRKSLPGKSVTKHVSDEDEWCAEAYMETDYSILCENDFIQKMRSYASYLVACSQPNKLFEFTNKPILQKKTTLNTNGWKWFTLDDGSESSLFKIDAGKYHYPSEYSEGKTPYLSATAINNGVGCYIDLEPEFEGNVMTTEKVHCTSFYQKNDFCATSDVNIIKCKKNVLNVYVGMFIISIIDFNENFRWNYGRQCRVNDTKSIRVKLPAVKIAPNKYEPDWQFMEDYIKSLPYSSCL